MGTALNALKLLELFSSAQPEIGLSNLARLSGMNKATTLRHLRALEEFGLIEQNPHSKSYAIGPAVVRLAALREIANPGLEGARARMQSAMQVIGESMHLSLLQQGKLQTALALETTRYTVRVSLDPAEILPINATASGLCLLSFGPAHLLEDLDRQALTSYTAETLVSPDLIRERVSEIRRKGWSNSAGGFEAGVYGYAAPVFGIDQVAIGTIAIAVPEIRANGDHLPLILTTLHSLSLELTANFGGQFPRNFPTAFQP